MPRLLSLAASFALFGLASCGRGHSVDKPNPAIADQVNAAASNISVTDGREATSPPATPQEAGAAMRSAAADPPRP